MRGKWVHNRVLIEPCAECLRRQGAIVRLEHAVQDWRTGGYVDLFAELHDLRIVVEGERSTRRLTNDLAKARRLRADILAIVFPTGQMARRAAQILFGHSTQGEADSMKIWLLPLGTALARLGSLSSSSAVRHTRRATEQGACHAPGQHGGPL